MSAVSSDRARDELQLTLLQLWDECWSISDIAAYLGITRSAVISFVHRVFAADPAALRRRPRRKQGEAAAETNPQRLRRH